MTKKTSHRRKSRRKSRKSRKNTHPHNKSHKRIRKSPYKRKRSKSPYKRKRSRRRSRKRSRRVYRTNNSSSCRSNAQFCTAYAKFDSDTLKILESQIPDNGKNTNEVAGPLELSLDGVSHENGRSLKFGSGKPLAVYNIFVDKGSIQMGNEKEVDAIATKYNFHTHPEAAYIAHNCAMGWPSRDDYIAFLDGFFRHKTTFHIIATKEGLYILKINPCVMTALINFYEKLSEKNADLFIDAVEDWADEHINISKVGLTRAHGKRAPKTGKFIKSEDQYVKFVNGVSCDKIKTLKLNEPIFEINYISWQDAYAGKNFIFTVKKENGKCKIT